jgi:hypothetical protein
LACAASRILNAFTADSAQRLKTLLLRVVVALGVTVIVHDGAPGKVLSADRVDEQGKSRRYKHKQPERTNDDIHRRLPSISKVTSRASKVAG